MACAVWSHKLPVVHPQVVVGTNCRSAGDSLRDLDQKALIEDDFVLVSGDVISNLDIAAVVREHQARKLRDSNAIMTMVGCHLSCKIWRLHPFL